MSQFNGEIHPYADMFPMLPDDDLDALAADISVNGQRHPILLTFDGVLVDGRNRLEACKRAGVPPKFRTIDADPVDYIISANMQRRDLTQGQKAHLAVAANSYKLEEFGAAAALARIAGVPEARIAEARVIAEYAPQLVPEVIAKQVSHAAAYAKATAEKEERAARTARLEELQRMAPDLLGMVTDNYTVEMAWVAYQERDKERIAAERDLQEARDKYTRGIWHAVTALSGHLASDERKELFHTLDLSLPDGITTQHIDEAVQVLASIRQKGKKK